MVTVFNGTKNLLDYARTNRTQSVLLASSLEVYGTITDDSTPLTEETQGYLDPMAVRSSYPMAKRAAENALPRLRKGIRNACESGTLGTDFRCRSGTR